MKYTFKLFDDKLVTIEAQTRQSAELKLLDELFDNDLITVEDIEE